MSRETIERAYELKCRANLGKLDTILEIFPYYRKTATEIAPHQWMFFWHHGKFDKDIKTDFVKTPISKRYQQTCQYQVVSILDSFIENRKNDVVDIIMQSSLHDDIKTQLCYINKYNKWFSDNVKMQKKSITKDSIKLARKIFKHVLSKHNKPSFKHINMNLDAKVAKLSASDDHSSFNYWIYFSLLNLDPEFKNDPIYIPLESNHYFDSQPGKICNFVQVNLHRNNGSLHFSLIKRTKQEKYKVGVKKIALDIGLKVLFATNEGDLFGRHFYRILSKYDSYITELSSYRQSHGLSVRCKEYDLLVSNLREYIKNEVNRCINRMIDLYHPGEIDAENLNFTHPVLSKRMNRLLRIFGLGIIKRKLASLEEKYGIKINYVNPAYTSQTCSSPTCGYVSKTNRKSRDRFECEYCKKKIHSDVGSARKILSRSSDKKITIYMSKEKVLHVETERFYMEQLRHVRDGGARCLNRWASELMSRNAYYTKQAWYGEVGRTLVAEVSSSG
jgi:putative transposase